jgi:hypothetical protein
MAETKISQQKVAIIADVDMLRLYITVHYVLLAAEV